MDQRPYSQACDENKRAILDILRVQFKESHDVLEIGSGTGQHAVFFGCALAHLVWHTSDVEANHAGIRAWLAKSGLPNVRAPLTLDVTQTIWPLESVDAVFSANTVHIMSWPMVEAMFSGIAGVLSTQGIFCLYGPFNYKQCYTSESNRRFDDWLKQRDPRSGVRNFEDLCELGRIHGLAFHEDVPMPANNRILIWRKC